MVVCLCVVFGFVVLLGSWFDCLAGGLYAVWSYLVFVYLTLFLLVGLVCLVFVVGLG